MVLLLLAAYQYYQRQQQQAEGRESPSLLSLEQFKETFGDRLAGVETIVQSTYSRCQSEPIPLFQPSSQPPSSQAYDYYCIDDDDNNSLIPMMDTSHHSSASSSTSSKRRVRPRETSNLSSSEHGTAVSTATTAIAINSNLLRSTPRTFVQDDIRQAYIDAVFGPAFFATRAYQPPRQGMGLAQIPEYVTYTASIPPPPVPFGGAKLPLEREPKLGMTLSKLALGLYVQKVLPNSEAALAGVTAGSILVSINGMGMLVEPSRHALERIWQYEGLFAPSQQHDNPIQQDDGSTSSGSNNNNNNEQQQRRPKMNDPLALTLYKDGRLYTALLLSNPSYYGIQWASCGSFCLVNRAYSYASSIGGVRRGSIVASVNGASLREMDHAQFGERIRDIFQAREETMQLCLAYTPAAGRTGFWERRAEEDVEELTNKKNKPKSFTQKRNGIEIRVHSFEESWQSLWGPQQQQKPPPEPKRGPLSKVWNSVTGRRCGGGSSLPTSTSSSSSGEEDLAGSVAELAGRVVEGQIVAPATQQHRSCHWSRQQRIYGPCPVLTKQDLTQTWDPLQALLFCLRGYRQLLAILPTDNNSSKPTTNDDHVQGFPHNQLLSEAEITRQIKELSSEDMIQTFLWQFISLIAYYQSNQAGGALEETIGDKVIPATTTAAGSARVGDPWMEEKKEERAAPSSTRSTTTTRNHFADDAMRKDPSSSSLGSINQNNDFGDVLTSLLLKLSRKDQDFCQRLYFCLRSTLKCLECDTDMAEQPPSSYKQNSNNHLLALFNCLKLLRSAEREAIDGGDLGSIMSVEQQLLTTSGTTTADSTADASYDTANLSFNSQKSNKGRLFGKLFRKKKSKRKGLDMDSSMESLAQDPQTPVSPKKQLSQLVPSPRKLSPRKAPRPSHQLQLPPPPMLTPLLENMSEFVKELDGICTSIEKRLLKSMSQKITDWALQPWSASKSTVLTSLTEGMRQSLGKHNGSVVADESPSKTCTGTRRKHRSNALPAKPFCLVNPLDSQELLVGIDEKECYILPSAHFPILLTFDAIDRQPLVGPLVQEPSLLQRGRDRCYRVVVEICSLSSSASRLVLHGAVGGVIQESVSSLQHGGKAHGFRQKLQFETRSSWGAPRTLSLRLSSVPEDSEDYGMDSSGNYTATDGGFGWVDLAPLWDRLERFQEPVSFCTAKIYAMGSHGFDEQGEFMSLSPRGGRVRPMRLECKVTTQLVSDDTLEQAQTMPLHRRLLLYKHDDDLRQEAFAIQFVKTCDTILKASGLDLKLLTFGCIPVGANRGFIEWVEGSVPLSDICQKPYSSFFGTTSSAATTATSSNDDNKGDENDEDNDNKAGADGDDGDDLSIVVKAGMSNYESVYYMGMVGLGVGNAAASAIKSANRRRPFLGPRGSLANNPIQDFLRSIAYDPEAPYFVGRAVMDNYVKSCAGYCVITYLLGVGDRHLDNLLIHNQTGSFFHCDYSFLFGKDPKKYLPVRVTEDMIFGMGGRESDNYAKFLSFTGCAFVTLRQPENVRLLLSLLRIMEAARLPDVIASDGAVEVALGLRKRLRLDLTEEQAVAYMEEMIESSLSSKIWMAVDAIHSLGKRF
ncbi:Phosphatidylinositol 3-kinase catalytic subunit type 3 [Seminavis robusta]|uniref:Phosphatidylinositol 3-kinase catalytic subunit type 3 n=1 Tax=Seminavis robusta TaxID=568900 RepID=A0A9N8EJB4_9STRA|nr:Phosphatidylinositol 3-kinase catalytic subunit type 3 [Seminavis robusta]|eukprot:Sro1091_g240250.1 Phosphatidylinositol 3-kinase catalytic subunit type 3 (1585) ;mRNA; r:8267-13021